MALRRFPPAYPAPPRNRNAPAHKASAALSAHRLGGPLCEASPVSARPRRCCLSRWRSLHWYTEPPPNWYTRWYTPASYSRAEPQFEGSRLPNTLRHPDTLPAEGSAGGERARPSRPPCGVLLRPTVPAALSLRCLPNPAPYRGTMPDPIPYKRCNCCRSVLPLSMFGSDADQLDGHARSCRECRRESYRRNRALSSLRSARDYQRRTAARIRAECRALLLALPREIALQHVTERQLRAAKSTRGMP